MSETGGRVLVICYGNLCRSPMAEGLLRDRLGEHWEVVSAGTHAYGGDAPSPTGVEAIDREFGIDISSQRSSALTVESLRAADHVLAMSAQQANIAAALGGAGERVRLLGSFAPDLTPASGSADPGGELASVFEVADPMGGSYDDYAACLRRLHDCVARFAEWIENGAPDDGAPASVASPGWRF